MDWFNEIWNAPVLHFTGRAPVWGAPGGDSAYLILIGLNIEICFMFSVLGVVAAKLLPADKSLRVLSLPNRWVRGGFTAHSGRRRTGRLHLSRMDLTCFAPYWPPPSLRP
ncbi:hypothetical protein AB4039_04235 [Streptomyces sp. M-16]|uniref:hypothetical protein n=1 Tax=Streptomyces sp. M-16 TaxID=3233040 RepID=UPI00225B7606